MGVKGYSGPSRAMKAPRCQLARALLEGLTEVQHIIVDAAYDAGHLRTVLADDIGATAHIKHNPTRREDHQAVEGLRGLGLHSAMDRPNEDAA